MNPQRDPKRIVLGAVVVLVGVLALADNLLQSTTRHALQFWPVVFLAMGAMKLSHARRTAGYVLGAGLMVLGMLMTLNNLALISFHLRNCWPLLVMGAGVALVVRRPWHHHDQGRQHVHHNLRRHFKRRLQPYFDAAAHRFEQTRTDVSATAVLSVNKRTVVTQDLRHGELTAVIGGLEMNFCLASMESVARLDVVAVMGGVEIKVPPQWRVDCNVVSFLGNVENKTIPAAQPTKRLVIEGVVMMGGVVVKN